MIKVGLYGYGNIARYASLDKRTIVGSVGIEGSKRCALINSHSVASRALHLFVRVNFVSWLCYNHQDDDGDDEWQYENYATYMLPCTLIHGLTIRRYHLEAARGSGAMVTR